VAANTGWLGLEQALDLVVAVGLSIAVARALGPENLGRYSYALTLVSLTGIVAALGAPLATRKYMAEYLARGEVSIAHGVLRTTLRFQGAIAFALAGLGLAWVAFAGQEAYLAPAIASLIPTLLRGIATGALLATEDARWVVRASITASLVHVVSVVLVLTFDGGLVGLTSALLLSRSLDFAVRWYFVQTKVPPRPPGGSLALPPELFRKVMSFSAHATTLLVVEILIWQRAEILFLEYFSPIENVAFFSISFGASQAVVAFPRVVAGAAGVTLMAEQGRRPERVAAMAAATADLVALGSILLGALTAGLAGPLIHLAYGKPYEPAIPVLTLLAIFAPSQALLFAARQFLIATDRQALLVRLSLLGAAANLGLALALIPSHGALGAAWTKVATQLLVSSSVWAVISIRFGVRLRIVPLARLAAWSVGVAVIMRVVTDTWPGLAGATLALGSGLFLLALGPRVTRAVDSSLRERLLRMGGLLPAFAQRPYGDLLTAVIGRVPADASRTR
jgi:O-antigen/teichoic acid export membrane protein